MNIFTDPSTAPIIGIFVLAFPIFLIGLFVAWKITKNKKVLSIAGFISSIVVGLLLILIVSKSITTGEFDFSVLMWVPFLIFFLVGGFLESVKLWKE